MGLLDFLKKDKVDSNTEKVITPYISQSFIEKIENCLWFSNCGNKELAGIDFDVKFVTRKQALKSVNSLRWENFCLDRRGELTLFLHLNHTEIYQKWNDIVYKVKDEYMNILSEKIEKILENKDLKEAFVDVRYNLTGLFVVDCYSKYYYSEFYDKMLKVYLAGHLPCGWEGTAKDGKMLVY